MIHLLSLEFTRTAGNVGGNLLCGQLNPHLFEGLSCRSAALSQVASDHAQSLFARIGNGWMGSFSAFAITLVIALAAIRWLGPMGFLDHPGGRKQHRSPIPRVGGLAILASFALAGSLGWLNGIFSPLAWLTLGGMALIGVLDDRFDLRARWKALGGLAIGILLAALATYELTVNSGSVFLFGFDLSGMPLLLGSLLLMLFWGIPQAFNLIDGADGLALGFGLISLTVLAVAGSPLPYVIGCVAALFILNWPKSRLFLGDCGSLGLGLFLAMLAFKTFGKTKPEAILWLFAYPTADVVQVVTVRIATGRAIGRADRNHFHHRWKDALGERGHFRVPILWIQGALCASGAVVEGPWRLLPWLGLAGILLQCSVFICQSIRRHGHQHRVAPLQVRGTGGTEPNCRIQTEEH